MVGMDEECQKAKGERMKTKKKQKSGLYPQNKDGEGLFLWVPDLVAVRRRQRSACSFCLTHLTQVHTHT